MKRFGHLIGLATELGVTMGLTAAGLIILGLWLGRWLDARLGTSPLATILLIVAGAIAGQVAIYRLAYYSTKRLSAGESHAWRPQDAVSALGLALRVLLIMTLPALIGIGLGLWLDTLAGTGILITIGFAAAGLITGLLGTLSLVRARRPSAGEKGADTWSNTED